MSGELIVRHCAPTLAGIKTGSLFSLFFDSKQQLLDDIRSLNRSLVPKGLCMLPLTITDKRALLYLYRPSELSRDLKNEQAAEMLADAGYGGLCCEQCVRRLGDRLRAGGDFPHEVGLFLSYPPEDVRGFIDNRAENCKLAGMWKVYGDVDRAKKLFSRYKKCTEDYCARLRAGSDIDKLAVRTRA